MSYTSSDHGCDELLISLDWLMHGWNIAGSLVAAFIGLVLFIYYWKKGQFEEMEETKYEVFRDD